jgi:precorrin-3B synthase
MTGPTIKGWCPGALRPMLSGDGWLVRIRPPMGELTPAQAKGVARAALTHGNGTIDLSSRANLQLRGIREQAHGPLIDDLRALGLVDEDAATEASRNLVITPFRDAEAGLLAAGLTQALADLPPLPGKFGFAVDTGAHPVLTNTPADIRLERGQSGRLILRADGHPFGQPVTPENALSETISLSHWFLAQGGMTNGRGRMAGLIARGITPDGCTEAPAAPAAKPAPGLHPEGALVALAFGQMQAETLLALANCDHVMRLTPWRMILLAGAATLPNHTGLITTSDDPLLRVTACTGAPGCPQALGPTRQLARTLAPLVTSHLHVSGCTKGCAHPAATTTTLVATPRGYHLIRGGSAADTPHLRDLLPHLIPDALNAP